MTGGWALPVGSRQVDGQVDGRAQAHMLGPVASPVPLRICRYLVQAFKNCCAVAYSNLINRHRIEDEQDPFLPVRMCQPELAVPSRSCASCNDQSRARHPCLEGAARIGLVFCTSAVHPSASCPGPPPTRPTAAARWQATLSAWEQPYCIWLHTKCPCSLHAEHRLPQATAAEIQLLANEGAVPPSTSQANWVRVTLVNRALRHLAMIPAATRARLHDLEAAGVGGMEQIIPSLPSRLQTRVRAEAV